MGSRLAAFPDFPKHTQQVTLDGVAYLVTFTWRDRTASWYLDFALLDGTVLIAGMRVSPSWPLNLACLDGGPPGLLYCRGVDAYVRSSLGTDDLAVIYYTVADIESAAVAADGPTFVAN